MNSPKKRPNKCGDHLEAKRLRHEDDNKSGTTLTDSSDDEHETVGFGFGKQTSYPSFVGAQKENRNITRHSTEDAPMNNGSSSGFCNTLNQLHGSLVTPEGQHDTKVPKSDLESPQALRKEPTEKKAIYSDAAARMMAKMGYKEGKGLGKHQQGRATIIETSIQKGRRGLGHDVKGFEKKDVDWDFEKEEVHILEEVSWIPPCAKPIPSLDEMRTWMKEGPKKVLLDDETEFVSPEILTNVLKCKSVFDNLEDEEMRRARTRSNPYETIRGVIFMNRAAMKMANMDAVTGFMFTNPKDANGHSLVRPDELLYFADICAGPGGFSEYVLWRKKWEAKGFGFTLKGPCDFKLEEFFAASSEFFEPHYGVGILDGDGDIYKSDNQKVFREFVWESTDQAGLHFVMADGGFSVEGQENNQEILSKRLYLCQFLVALSVLRVGGHFVCKLFDIFTPFSVGLVYLMYRAFRRISIFKPVTSRPANSERYIICEGLRPGIEPILEYMCEINEVLERTFSRTLSEQDVIEVVPIDIMKADIEFYNYIRESNEHLGKMQAQALVKIQTFAQNNNLHETRQAAIREQLLKLWDIPDELRTAPDKSEQPQSKFQKMIEGRSICVDGTVPELTKSTLNSIHSVFDYKCLVTASDDKWFLLSLGKLQVWKWNGLPKCPWLKVDDVHIELPRDTLIEAEFVHELRGEGKGQRKEMAVHVIDALVLCQVNIQDLHYKERIQKLQKFVKAISRPTRKDLAPIRVKDVFKLEEIDNIFNRLELKQMKGSLNKYRLCYMCGGCQDKSAGHQSCVSNAAQPRYFIPAGLLLIKTEKDPWMLAFSRSKKRWYWYNTMTRESLFSSPKDCIGDYSFCLKKRLYWKWGEGVKLHEQQTKQDSSKLSKEDFTCFIHERINPS